MTASADDIIREMRADIARAVNVAAERLRAELGTSDPEQPRWLPLKAAAGEVGKSERVVWTAAQRTLGASWLHGKRRMVNMDKLPIKPPPR